MKSDEISALRARLGITKTELAGALRVTSATVYRWEDDGSPPSPPFAAMLGGIQRALDEADGDVTKFTKLRSSLLQGVEEVFYRGLRSKS